MGTSGNPTLDQHVTYGYQADGRLNAIAAGGQSFSYGYVSNSHLIGTTTNSGSSYTDTRTYASTRDWLTQRETVRSSVTKAKFAYTHDNLGRVTQADRTGEIFDRYGNGTQGLKVSYDYNPRNELTSEITYLGGTSTVLTGRNDAYTYDQLGNRKTTTHNGDTATYTLKTNGLNQYDTRTAPRVFDVAGAAGSGATVTVTSPVPPAASSQPAVTRHGEYFFQGRQFTPTGAIYSTLTVSDGSTNVDVDAFVTATPEGFTYDADGNLMSDGRWTYTFDTENTYTYDAENRPTWMETSSAAVSAGHPRVAVYSLYDYLGRRVRKIDYTHNGSAWVLQDDRRFVYQGWNQVAEFWGAYNGGAFVSTYSRQMTWGLDVTGTMTGAGGVGGLLMVQEGGQSYLPAYDALGNIHAMIKASDGSIAAAYEYDSYGKTVRESGPYAEANPFRFSTKYTDIETGLIYHDTRYYSPPLGRFVTRDTIGEQGGLNLYAYVRNGVPNAWDRLGMDPWTATDGRVFSSFEDMVAYNGMLAAQDELYWLEYEDGYGDRQAFRRFLYDPHAGLSATGRAEALTYYVESFRTTDGRTVQVASGTTLQHFENGQVVVSSDPNVTAVGTVSLSGGSRMPTGVIFAGETTTVDAWHDPVVTSPTVTEIPDFWAGRDIASAYQRAYESADQWRHSPENRLFLGVADSFAERGPALREWARITQTVGLATSGLLSSPAGNLPAQVTRNSERSIELGLLALQVVIDIAASTPSITNPVYVNRGQFPPAPPAAYVTGHSTTAEHQRLGASSRPPRIPRR